MSEFDHPNARYNVWQAMSAALSIGMRALEEVRALANRPAVKPDPEVIRDMIVSEVRLAIGELSATKDGKSIDAADVERMIAAAIAKVPVPQRGPEGPAGKFTGLTPWSRCVHYESSLVTHAGSTYCALRDTADEPPHEDWALVAARGSDAPVGEVCGLHDPDRQYRKFDLVAWNGSEWRAKHDDPGPLPGDGWAMAAKVGKPGRPGDPGPKGEPGIDGKPGPAGPKITEWRKDGYRAIPVMSDGTVGPALDVREFFELYRGEVG